MSTEHFHAVVIGSGFGGSVMAYRLAEAGRSVCLLERGKKYPPGSFPRSPAGMKENFWDPSVGLQGMYDVWSFRELAALVASGLGGGSLIYANVLIRKDERWFVQEDLQRGGYESWPISRADLDPHYDRVEKILAPQRYPVESAPYDQTPKLVALRAAAATLSKAAPPGHVEFLLPNLAVSFANPGQPPVPGEPISEAFPNLHGRTRSTCRLCGECDIGCNYGSKNTLDYNYLTLAARAAAEIRTRAEVRAFAPRAGGGYQVHYVEHSDGVTNTAALPVRTISCDRLILAAGALGSTFLLLKNAAQFPGLSQRLGHAISGNGDILGLALQSYDHQSQTGRVLEPSRGPVITGALRFADELDGTGASGRGFYVEDAGYPEFINWLAQSANVAGSLSRLGTFAWRWLSTHFGFNPSSDLSAAVSGLIGSANFTRSSLPLLGMGRDVPSGRAFLNEQGYLALDWSLGPSKAYFDKVRGAMRDVSSALGAKYADGPLWYLSQEITVHPLGGCPMGSSREEGVVDAQGEVFGFPGFYIADGSVLPGPVGPNPSLTIAACADRFADRALGH